MRKAFHFIRNLPRTVFNLLLSLSASAYVVVVFLIKESITFPFLPQQFECVSYIIYLMIPIVVVRFCLCLSRYLPVCGMECQIEEVELASHFFYPITWGIFSWR